MTSAQPRSQEIKDRYFIDNALLREGWGKILGPYGIAIYNAIALHADKNQQCYPSNNTLANLTGMSIRQVIREVERLESHQLVKIQSRQAERKPAIYTLLDKSEWIKEPAQHMPHSHMLDMPASHKTPSHMSSDSESYEHMPGSHTNNTHKQDPSNKTQSATRLKPEPIPAVKIHVEETGKYLLNKPQIKEVAEVIGDTPIALEKWRNVVKAWVLRGFDPRNLPGMLDWFRNGIPVYKNGTHQNSPPAPSSKSRASPAIDADLLRTLQQQAKGI